MDLKLINQAINSLRILSLDGVENAKSGHPGLPLGAAPMAYELWANHMNHNPKNPHWHNRDRFILSAGHGSMLLYSLLHMFGYEDMPLEELKQFRQWGSKTAGHPEFRHTEGIETTTGPLGAGVSTAVGMAVAEAHLAAVFNKENYPIVDHYTYALVGDGCLMEGVASEAMSFAGTQKLNKFIVLWDSNNITIEGNTDLAFREDVKKRMEAYGYNILVVEDGNDLEAISKAIEEAKQSKDKPTFIEVKTQIGYGSPLVGTSKAHSDPMGEEKALETRKNLGWENATPFEVPTEVYDHYKAIAYEKAKAEDKWNELLAAYKEEYPELGKKYEQYYCEDCPVDLLNDDEFWNFGDKDVATRAASGTILNRIKDSIPNLIGGSADLAPSNKTFLEGSESFDVESRQGRNIHFGVRENGMAAIANGIAMHGGLRSYCATFFVFTDYAKPMMRLASLMQAPTIFVMTHDSIGVGEDGPTHQPIEQLSMLRAQPNMIVYRPADARETAAGYYVALNQDRTPTTLALSRQNLPQLEGSSKEAIKGGYVISKAENAEGILIASGSEVSLALEAQKALKEKGVEVSVVSMPSLELFEQQSDEYKESVLPKSITKRVAIEAGASMPWFKYVGLEGKVLGIDKFGASAPANRIFEEYGFTVKNVVSLFESIK